MEGVLTVLIGSLRAASQHLHGSDCLYHSKLHDNENLSNPDVFRLAEEALDLLSDVRLLLEPGHLVLADHFLGDTPHSKFTYLRAYEIRLYENEMSLRSCPVRSLRYSRLGTKITRVHSRPDQFKD
jgi:hypothetical protein